MPSRNYELFLEAMRRHRQIVCTYNGKRREVCPVILGQSAGAEKVLTFQFGGESSTQLPSDGEWRCLAVGDVSDIELREGPWRAGTEHGSAQTCVTDVDYDINPNSPYNPKYRL